MPRLQDYQVMGKTLTLTDFVNAQNDVSFGVQVLVDATWEFNANLSEPRRWWWWNKGWGLTSSFADKQQQKDDIFVLHSSC